MRRTTKLVAGIAVATSLVVTGTSIVSAAIVVPVLPAEQQALVDAGYTKTTSWAKFDKQDGACHITVEKSGNNYYVFTKGKRKASMYPVIPGQVVNAAALLDANCQG